MTANRARERGTRVMKGNEGREGWMVGMRRCVYVDAEGSLVCDRWKSGGSEEWERADAWLQRLFCQMKDGGQGGCMRGDVNKMN